MVAAWTGIRVFGARALRRAITSRIEHQLSEHLLRGEIAAGDTVVVDINLGGGFTLRAQPRRQETARQIPDLHRARWLKPA